MTEKLKQRIKEEIQKLSRETQEVINVIDWPSVTEVIGKKNKLDQIEINNLQIETLLILIGAEPGDSYTRNIENEVGTSKDEAEKIANEVFEKIFTPIADKLEENIKKSLEGKEVSAMQNVDFILSGGDYSVFVAPPRSSGAEDKDDTKLLGSSNILETKDRLIN